MEMDIEELEPGDPNCPQGGAALSYGFDSGAGEGTAGDGELQDKEIVEIHYICNGS